MDPDNKKPQKSAKGYGKRPMWQWMVLYLAIAIIVYFAIYLIFFHKSSGGGVSY